MRAYAYLVLTSQVQVTSSIVGNSAPAADTQKVFKGTFKTLINVDYSIRAFVREELMHVSGDTQVPPDWVSEWK